MFGIPRDRYCDLHVGSSKPRARDKSHEHITIKNVAKPAGGERIRH
jgi:hypothetical protein